jgi:alpha-tubulin suppressor-like RCC1 family protein
MSYLRGSLALLLAALAGAACTPRLGDGAFACDPDDVDPCPAGFACQVRAPVLEHRCYQSLGQSYCGDGVVDPGEECDGLASDTVTCHDLGYWYGTPRCSERCRIEGEGCVGLRQVVMGAVSTCVLDDRGQAWCWGYSPAGVLGHGSMAGSVTPVPVAVSEPLASLAASSFHVCALDLEGRAWCWGDNLNAQLGQGQATERIMIPTPVDTTLRFQQLAAGRFSTCGLDPEGRIWCWGAGNMGQLGNGRLDAVRVEPVAVESTAVFTQVASAMTAFCGLAADGQAWCWGSAHLGKLGDGQPLASHRECVTDGYCSPVPVAVAGDHRFVALADGNAYHVCGLDADGVAWCWGYGETGALGQPEAADRDVPVPVSTGAALTALAVGVDRTTAVDASGRAWVWGLGAGGDGAAMDSPVAVAASLDAPAVAVATGFGSSCALQAPGRLTCWGFGGSGQLGTASRGAVPRPLVSDDPLVTLAPGLFHNCGLDADGRAHCWGLNSSGQLGSSLPVGSFRSVPVTSPADASGFAAMTSGNSFTAALTSDGEILLWGGIDLGGGAYLSSLEPVALGGSPKVGLAAGAYHLCALDAEGQAWCWGANVLGELGTTAPTTGTTPVAVAGDHRFTRLALGASLSCGIADDGAAWCWGDGSSGQLGTGGRSSSALPVAVASDQRFEDLSCGWAHCCGVAGDGSGWCWGQNTLGTLGSGSAASIVETPQAVAFAGAFARIVASYNFNCGLDAAGQAWCWGGSDWGDPVLGNGVVADRFVPVAVDTALRFDDLVSKGWHTCGLAPDGAWHCWGGNAMGQLGIDDQITTPLPVRGPDLP